MRGSIANAPDGAIRNSSACTTARLPWRRSVLPILPTLLLALLLVLSGPVVCGPSASAGTGQMSPSLILGSPKLKVSIDSRWVPGDGYRPLRLHANTVGGVPLRKDRQLTIELRPNAYGNVPERRILKTYNLPAGLSTLSKTIYLPENLNCDYCNVRIWVGRYDPKTAGSLTLDMSGSQGLNDTCLLYTSPSPRDATLSRMPSSA